MCVLLDYSALRWVRVVLSHFVGWNGCRATLVGSLYTNYSPGGIGDYYPVDVTSHRWSGGNYPLFATPPTGGNPGV